jgi:stearoyl-CoA desaturase (delta-9 desaturase)
MMNRPANHQRASCRRGTRASRRAGAAIALWFDASGGDRADADAATRIDWLRVLPFIGMHVACLGVFVVGVSWFAVAVAAGLYGLRMFAMTGFYHRYFSHRAFRTSRTAQFVFAVIGASCVQRGPL